MFADGHYAILIRHGTHRLRKKGDWAIQPLVREIGNCPPGESSGSVHRRPLTARTAVRMPARRVRRACAVRGRRRRHPSAPSRRGSTVRAEVDCGADRPVCGEDRWPIGRRRSQRRGPTALISTAIDRDRCDAPALSAPSVRYLRQPRGGPIAAKMRPHVEGKSGGTATKTASYGDVRWRVEAGLSIDDGRVPSRASVSRRRSRRAVQRTFARPSSPSTERRATRYGAIGQASP